MTGNTDAVIRKHVIENFIKRHNIRMRFQQRNKNLTKESFRDSLIQRHVTTRERLVRTGGNDSYDANWGLFQSMQRLNVDRFHIKRTYHMFESDEDEHKSKGVSWYGLPNATDLWQPIEAGYGSLLKVFIQQVHSNWLDADDNADRWFGNVQPYSSKERCILIVIGHTDQKINLAIQKVYWVTKSPSQWHIPPAAAPATFNDATTSDQTDIGSASFSWRNCEIYSSVAQIENFIDINYEVQDALREYITSVEDNLRGMKHALDESVNEEGLLHDPSSNVSYQEDYAVAVLSRFARVRKKLRTNSAWLSDLKAAHKITTFESNSKDIVEYSSFLYRHPMSVSLVEENPSELYDLNVRGFILIE
eukprot:gene8179-14110_t